MKQEPMSGVDKYMTDKNVITLEKYFDTRFSDLEKRLDERAKTAEHSLDSAAGTLEKRLESMNEFREQLKDQASRFITCEVLESKLFPIDKDVGELKTFRVVLDAKASQRSVWIFGAITIINFIMGIFVFLIR